MTPTPKQIARWLAAQHRGRITFGDFPLHNRPADLVQAYAAQDAFVAIKARQCGRAVGWKIALSNQAMQQLVGLDAPVAGRLLARQVVGGPARTRVSAYGRLLIEFEIAIELAADLPAPGGVCTREQAGAAVAAVRPAFELADDRGANYASLGAHAFQLIADNAWNEGAVLGERRSDWHALNLQEISGRVYCDDKLAGEGLGRDLMGHPLDALAWLAGCAAGRGQMLRKGDIAILGSMVTSKFPEVGQEWRFELAGFEPLRLNIDP